mmetsp:Transcript_75998/g.219471  ORF Transcript_75998/g.219471 Transcript_75998/m.219471 type:complete len:263 (-) Transcript_75998:685-1473(-)
MPLQLSERRSPTAGRPSVPSAEVWPRQARTGLGTCGTRRGSNHGGCCPGRCCQCWIMDDTGAPPMSSPSHCALAAPLKAPEPRVSAAAVVASVVALTRRLVGEGARPSPLNDGVKREASAAPGLLAGDGARLSPPSQTPVEEARPAKGTTVLVAAEPWLPAMPTRGAVMSAVRTGGLAAAILLEALLLFDRVAEKRLEADPAEDGRRKRRRATFGATWVSPLAHGGNGICCNGVIRVQVNRPSRSSAKGPSTLQRRSTRGAA